MIAPAFALAGILGMSAPAAASRNPDAPPQIEVAIDTSTLDPEMRVRLRHALDDELTAALREQGIEVVNRSAELRLEARVELVDLDLREYAISIELVLAGKREVLINALTCAPCSEALVIKQTVALLPAAARRIEAATESPSAPADAPQSSPESGRRLGPAGITGVATLSGGLGSVIAGAILVDNAPTTETSRQTGQAQGAALVGVGVAAALLGVTAVALDLSVWNRQRRERRVNLHIDASSTSAAMWLTGRF
jgi:hypothetical protein